MKYMQKELKGKSYYIFYFFILFDIISLILIIYKDEQRICYKK